MGHGRSAVASRVTACSTVAVTTVCTIAAEVAVAAVGGGRPPHMNGLGAIQRKIMDLSFSKKKGSKFHFYSETCLTTHLKAF